MSFSPTSVVIFKVESSYFEVNCLNLTNFCPCLAQCLLEGLEIKRGSIWGFLRTAGSIMSFSTASDVIFRVKRSYFKVIFLNFAN